MSFYIVSSRLDATLIKILLKVNHLFKQTKTQQ